jgi:chemotaxis protein methyltransferase CheR
MTTAPALSKRDEAAESLSPGEYRFTPQDFARIAGYLYEDSGIYLPESKVALVYSRLAKRLRALGLESFHDYCALVGNGDDPKGQQERRQMLAALTTNVTRFFREPHHFEDLARTTLPELVRKARAGGRVRLWSAGCSSGQEPYSLALVLLSALPEAADLDVRILASDIDPIMVGQGREGLYSEESVEAIPAEMRRHLVREGASWRMGEAVRRMTAFRELNLMDAWPMKGRFQVIFCRNVAIYFDDPTQQRLWERFAEVLEPGGRLYIGHSERVSSSKFENDGLTAYRLGSRR